MKALWSAACLTATVLLTSPASAQTISIITTPVGSYSNSAGAAMAKVIVENSKLRALTQAQASAGFDEVEAGTVEFNLSNAFDATFFATGTGDYANRPPAKNMRQAATLIPYRTAMHVRADSDIKTMADLKGKRVSSGFNAQKTIGRLIEAHLANAGLSYADVQSVPTPNVVRQAEDFTSGKVDVMFFAIGSGAIKQAGAAVGGLRVLPIDDTPAAMDRMQKLVPGVYSFLVNPSPSIDGVTAPTKILAFDMSMNTSTAVSENVVYQTVKALHGGKAALAATFPPFNLFDPAKMAKPTMGVQWHPGAVKFYKEAGLMK